VDGVLPEPGRPGSRPAAQGGHSAGGTGRGHFRVISEQGEPGQLQIQRRIPAGLRGQAAPGRVKRLFEVNRDAAVAW
ncbi:MAG TPA: hypothetical protein VHO07_27810, partial [Streptosporangiaceae bacterium]|nr:hypothetical protein [Streptosporangiaceae bacterium]